MGNGHRRYYRRAPHLVLYWEDEQLVFENYATGEQIEAEPLACTVLSFFDRWRPVEELFDHLSEYTPGSLRKTCEQLARCALLEESRRPKSHPSAPLENWKDWNPAAGLFHFSTRNQQYFSSPEEEKDYLRELESGPPPPPALKRYPKARQVALPKPARKGEFVEVLLRRRTWRRFSSRAITLEQLGTLLGLTGGVQGWMDVPPLGRLALKTSPSGGARHPIELYVLALRVAGLPRGLYHYAAGSHRLELLRRGAHAREVPRYLGGQWWFQRAAALVLMTAVLPRVQWKYQSPRAYRVVLADAGHLCQTFCLVATWLGLAPFCTMALADTKIERALGVDGVREVILYAAGVGTRPADGIPDEAVGAFA